MKIRLYLIAYCIYVLLLLPSIILTANKSTVSKLKINIHSFHLTFVNSESFESELSSSITGNITILNDDLMLNEDMILIADDNFVYKANIQRSTNTNIRGIIVPNTFQFNPPTTIKYFTASTTVIDKIKYYSSTLTPEAFINLRINALKPIQEDIYLLICVITSFSISFLSFWLFSGIFICATERNKLPLHHITSKLPQFICLLSFVNYYRISFNVIPLNTIAFYTYMILACFYKALFFGIIASIAHGWQLLYFTDCKLKMKLFIGLMFIIDYLIEMIVWITTDYPITDIGYFTIIVKNCIEYSLLIAVVSYLTYRIIKALNKIIKCKLYSFDDDDESSLIIPALLLKKKYTIIILGFTIGYSCFKMILPFLEWLIFIANTSAIMQKVNDMLIESLMCLIFLLLFRPKTLPWGYLSEINLFTVSSCCQMVATIPYGLKGIDDVNYYDKRLNDHYRNKSPIVILHPCIWNEDIEKPQLINNLSIGYVTEDN